MKSYTQNITRLAPIFLILGIILGCGGLSKPAPEWVKQRKIAGKEQKLSHISDLAVDDKFAYVTMGGTVADQNEGTSGLRKIALDTGAVTSLDNGANTPQSEIGGMVIDKDFVYWNAAGKIWRISKDGDKPETVASERVGIGVDMAIDGENIYWANHGYYSGGSPQPTNMYFVSKKGGNPAVFAADQLAPGNLVVDEKYVYWVTPTGIFKQAKSNGKVETVFQANDKEGVDKLSQDGDSLYFGHRRDGGSRWALSKISKQGGEPQILVKSYSLTLMAVDETNVYFFDEESTYVDAFCKVPKNGGDVTRIDTGYAYGNIAQDKTHVYFGSLDSIYSFAK